MKRFVRTIGIGVFKYFLFILTVFAVLQAASYAERWCPTGTDPEAQPHCLVQPYLSYWGVSLKIPHPRVHVLLPGDDFQKAPRALAFRDGMTLTSAINAVGGFTKLANSKRVYILRGGSRDVYNLDTLQLIDPQLRPEDIVIVAPL